MLDAGAERIKKSALRFDDEQHLLRPLHRALPAVNASQTRNHAHTGGQALVYQLIGDSVGFLARGASAEDDDFVGHGAIPDFPLDLSGQTDYKRCKASDALR